MNIDLDTFDRLCNLVTALVPDHRGIALCDRSGTLVHATEDNTSPSMSDAVTALSKLHPDWPQQAVLRRNAVSVDGRTLFACGITDGQGEVIVALVIDLNTKQTDGASPATLQPAIDALRCELELNAELDAMAVELTERYEELNLVYHTEDQVNVFRELTEALGNLVQNCVDYLDVNMTALILQEKGIAIIRNHSEDTLADAAFVNAKLNSEFYAWMLQQSQPLVINNMSEPLAVELLSGVPYKVLCAPIMGSDEKVAGILATINNYAKPNFSNSDKNLLQVMARKATKILVANYDNLTGLINRNGYEYFLESAFSDIQLGEAQHCVLHINIDKLHIVNDTISQSAGDKVIRNVAARLKKQIRGTDSLARLGGDSFGILLHDCEFHNALEFARRCCSDVEQQKLTLDGEEVRVTISAGIAGLSAGSGSVAHALTAAELACSVAKDSGGNRAEAYSADNLDMVRRGEQMHLVARIQKALTENRFTLHCQAIESLSDVNVPRHFEILMRLVGEDGQLISPATFIPAAERYHLMPDIDRWVVTTTLSSLADQEIGDDVFAINLSGQSIDDRDFLKFVQDQIASSGIPAQNLCFELTETAAIANLHKAVTFISSLRRLGCSFSLDDFGSGISSFGYLKSLPVDFLKIDGEIVKDIVDDETSAAMVLAINHVGRTMNLRTIAEFVENDAIREKLCSIGVDFGQGYGIGKPRPLSDLLNSYAGVAGVAQS